MACGACGARVLHAVAPVGVKYHTCPKCRVRALTRVGDILPEYGVQRQTCPHCKGQVFAVMRDHLICQGCAAQVVNYWPPEGGGGGDQPA
jgi:Zn-finger nucleic acid-binding protein